MVAAARSASLLRNNSLPCLRRHEPKDRLTSVDPLNPHPPFVHLPWPPFPQVCTIDGWNRYTCEGYAWLSLTDRVPGSDTCYLTTWKPMASMRGRQQEYFIGGSAELEDLTYLTKPGGAGGSNRLLNKYGFRTETAGSIKVGRRLILILYLFTLGLRILFSSPRPAPSRQAGAGAVPT